MSGPAAEERGADLILHLPSALSFFLVGALAIAVSLLGLYFVRRRYSIASLKENHEVAAIIFNAFGWLYAVIVAFAVFVTWGGYTDASKNLQLEANSALDVFYSAESFPPAVAASIRGNMIDYLRAVDEDELARMGTGNIVLRSASSLRNLIRLFNGMDEKDAPNRELYAETLQRLDSLADYRRLRIFSGSDTVPTVVWLVLLSGGVITVCSTYFFGMPRSLAQYAMTAMLTFTLSLILFLIFVLDHPFVGANRVSDAPLRQVLKIMQESSPAVSNSR
ncbi:MAG: DUF4239 domain-containing protein [Verrucomicrobiota bacterium]